MTSTKRSLVTTVRIRDFCGNAYHRAPVSSKVSLKEKVFAVTPYLRAKLLFEIGWPFDAVLISNEKKNTGISFSKFSKLSHDLFEDSLY